MRKLLKLAAMTFVAMAFAGVSASSASAWQFDFYTDDTITELCSDVSVNPSQGYEVTGGCLTEGFDGGFSIHAYTPNFTLYGNYDSTFDLVLDADGDGVAVNQTVSGTDGAPPRVACQTANGKVPWPVDSHWEPYGWIQLDIMVGISSPGGSCSWQTITVDLDPYGPPRTLDQSAPSANLSFGHWESNGSMWVDIG